MKLLQVFLLSVVICCLPELLISQETGTVSGNFQIEAQSYVTDSIIGAENVPDKFRSNGYLNLIYTSGKFDIGMRYENYMKPLLGFEQNYEGQGIAYRYATYKSDDIDITAGNFYEQFGSGMIFRAYEEWTLGIDNSVDGLRVKLRPVAGFEFTGIIGKQRLYWERSRGSIRGGNLDLNINELIGGFLSNDYQLSLGASVISKYQEDDNSFLNLPENTLAYSTRASLTASSFNLDVEYSYKYNDPNATNKYSFNPGSGLLVSGAYYTDGFGISLMVHRIDNMDFRSDRSARGNELLINYIPPLTVQHTYGLASIYPFSTKMNGEAGLQAEINYKIPKDFYLIGGSSLTLNYALVKGMDTTWIDKYEYKINSLYGDRTYFQDINIELQTKWAKNFKSLIKYLNVIYDKDILENEGAPDYGQVKADILILDLTYNIDRKNTIRGEFQHIWAKQDSALIVPDNVNGNWLQFLFEYTIAPSWFITFYDQYNYGNDKEENQIHYLNGSLAYVFKSSRVQLGYGKQRKGILCVGGVCRAVPASNGLYLSVSSSF